MGGLLLSGALGLLIGASPVARSQVRFGIGIAIPGVSIGINIPAYPYLVPIPGYPVYYAPNLNQNLFFYDGLYWIFVGDNWYYSSWYDGPWYAVQPEIVPDFILRIPILYYRAPPPYFLRWNRGAPPRWGEHWGRQWERRRPGWDRWDRRSIPPRAPLPNYQRNYPRPRYPGPRTQRSLENRYYRFQPRNEQDRRRLERPPERRVPNRPPAERRPGAPPPGAYRQESGSMRAPGGAPQRPSRAAPQASRPPAARSGPQSRNAAPREQAQRKGRPPPSKEKRDERGPPHGPPM